MQFFVTCFRVDAIFPLNGESQRNVCSDHRSVGNVRRYERSHQHKGQKEYPLSKRHGNFTHIRLPRALEKYKECVNRPNRICRSVEKRQPLPATDRDCSGVRPHAVVVLVRHVSLQNAKLEVASVWHSNRRSEEYRVQHRTPENRLRTDSE